MSKPFDFASFAEGLEAHMARQDVRDNWSAAEMARIEEQEKARERRRFDAEIARIEEERKIINRNELKTPEIKLSQKMLKPYDPQARYRS